MPLLGCTWVVGLFAVNENTTVFSWLFIALNSLQVCLTKYLLMLHVFTMLMLHVFTMLMLHVFTMLMLHVFTMLMLHVLQC